MRRPDLSGFAPYAAEPLPPEPDPDPDAAIVDGTLAQALNNGFIARQQALLNDGPDAFHQKQGVDALAAAPAVLDQLDALRDHSSARRQIRASGKSSVDSARPHNVVLACIVSMR
jgi:hypothetical protein